MKKLRTIPLSLLLFLLLWVSSCKYPNDSAILSESTEVSGKLQNEKEILDLISSAPDGKNIDLIGIEDRKILANFKNTYDESQIKNVSKNGRLSGDSTDKEVALWHLSKTYKNTQYTLMSTPVVVNSNKNKSKGDIEQIYYLKQGDKEGAFRIKIKPEGKQDKGFSGSIIVSSLDRKQSKAIEHKDGKKIKSNKRVSCDDCAWTILLPEVTITASSNNAWSFVMVAEVNPTFQIYLPFEVPQGNSGASFFEATLQDLINQLAQTLSSYSTTITAAEDQILDEQGFWAHLQYRMNAVNAELEARMRFGNQGNCQDNPCNSFKHAFFNAQNASDFGIAYARRLGQSRENNLTVNPNTLLPNFNCDSQNGEHIRNYMDLYNNERGYQAFTDQQNYGGMLSGIVMGMYNSGMMMVAPGCP